jgi:hypothetical protein
MERQDETQFTTKIDAFFSISDRMKLSLPPKLMLSFLSHPVNDQTQGSGAVFSLLYG